LDTGKYPKGIKVGKQEFAGTQVDGGETGRRDRAGDLGLPLSAGNQQVEQDRDAFHGEWNYAIMPRS
jgi:hypothetical protein